MQTLSWKTPSARIEPLPQLQAEGYLEKLHLLIEELHVAMAAIAGRELPGLEESISKQQAICARLAQASTAQPSCFGSSGSAADSELAQRIQTATATLVTLNRCYSRLLQHSSETVRLFKGLYTNCTSPGSDPLLRWSCEL